MSEIYANAEVVMKYLHNEYLKRQSKGTYSIKSVVSSPFVDDTDLDRLGRALQQSEWVEYTRQYGQGFVSITDKGIEIMQNHGSIGDYFRFEESQRLATMNNKTPAIKPSDAESHTIKRNWSGVIKGIKTIYKVILIAIIIPIVHSIFPSFFDHLVIEPLIDWGKKSISSSPPKQPTNLIPKKNTKNKVTKPDTINKIVIHKK